MIISKRYGIVLWFACAAPVMTLAQNIEAQQSSSPAIASPSSTADVLKELASMRARIEQLEAELRRRDLGAPTPAVNIVTAEVATGKRPEAGDEKKAEPFAF